MFVCLAVMNETTSDSSATQHPQKKELLLVLKLLGEGHAHPQSSTHAPPEALVQALCKEEPLGATFPLLLQEKERCSETRWSWLASAELSLMNEPLHVDQSLTYREHRLRPKKDLSWSIFHTACMRTHFASMEWSSLEKWRLISSDQSLQLEAAFGTINHQCYI